MHPSQRAAAAADPHAGPQEAAPAAEGSGQGELDLTNSADGGHKSS
jgi:hypothetical protein